MVVKGIVAGDGEEKVLLDVLVLGAPDFLTAFVYDSVLVQVVSNSSGAGQGSKEMGEEFGFWGDGKREVGEDRSGRGRRGDDGDRGFNDGWQEVLDGDVGEGDSFDYFLEL
jgi:hypothetical protein